jgi:carbon-monoxide dehydrogenase small subunit
MSGKTNFRLNDQEISYDGNCSKRLLDVLREDFHLTGTKCGCKEGECGACSVIIDGKLINSCLVAMGSLKDSQVITIEGYAKTKTFEIIEKAYQEVSAVQCGFCIPGMVLATQCLLASNPKPTTEEIRVAISGNLCRCTGYNSIVNAVSIAAKKGEGLW